MVEIKNIKISSLFLSAVPLVLLAMGILGGVITFLLMPNPQVEVMGMGARLLAGLIFALLYTILMNVLLMLGAFLYNAFVQTLGFSGIKLDLEEHREAE